MSRLRLILPLGVCLLLLTACQGRDGQTAGQKFRPRPPAEPISAGGEEASETRESWKGELSTVDFSRFQDKMPAEAWAALAGYLPVLQEGAVFQWTEGWSSAGRGSVTIPEFHIMRWGKKPPNDEPTLNAAALQDLDGDKVTELILCLHDRTGYFLILHKEDSLSYGIDYVYRAFESLQQNGVYISSSGAGYNDYCKLVFQDGTFQEVVLGGERDMDYTVAGESVTAERYWAWTEEIMVGDVDWHNPSRLPPRRAPSILYP